MHRVADQRHPAAMPSRHPRPMISVDRMTEARQGMCAGGSQAGTSSAYASRSRPDRSRASSRGQAQSTSASRREGAEPTGPAIGILPVAEERALAKDEVHRIGPPRYGNARHCSEAKRSLLGTCAFGSIRVRTLDRMPSSAPTSASGGGLVSSANRATTPSADSAASTSLLPLRISTPSVTNARSPQHPAKIESP